MNDDGSVKPFIFRTCFIDPYQGCAIADFAYKNLGKCKVAFIYDVGNAYSAGILQYFEAQFGKLGGRPGHRQGRLPGQQYGIPCPDLQRGQGNPDVLVVPASTYRDIALIAKQMNALGLKMQLLGVDGWVADELLSMAGKELEGSSLTSGLSTDSPGFKDYNEQFQKAHKEKPTIYAYCALDALYAFEQGLRTSQRSARAGQLPGRQRLNIEE